MKDRDVVDAFVSFLRKHGHPGLKIDRRPDEENRNSADIDAVANSLAIEHTSIDTLPNQRRDSDWFKQAAGGIESEFPQKPPFRLNITLEYDAIIKGQNWASIRQALKSWIINDVSQLDDGRHILDSVPGIPFRLHVKKASARPPGIFFGRFEPHDDSLPDRIHGLFERKAKKLAKYHSKGLTTILLVESDDIALMNELILFEAIRMAYPEEPPAGVDQIWYADTTIPSQLKFLELYSIKWEP